MSENEVIRDCPSCEQGKHKVCNESVLTEGLSGDVWVPCPCWLRDHKEEAHA